MELFIEEFLKVLKYLFTNHFKYQININLKWFLFLNK